MWYLPLPQVGRVTALRPPLQIRGGVLLLGSLAAAMGLFFVGQMILAVVVPALLIVGYVLFVVRTQLPSRVSERWEPGGKHGVLFAPNALVLRRPACVTRIGRAAVMGVDDQVERIEAEPVDEHRALSSSHARRRIVLRATDGRVAYTVVVAQAEGQPQVLGAGDGFAPLERERMDGIKERLDAWVG